MSDWKRYIDALQWQQVDLNVWTGTHNGRLKAVIMRFKDTPNRYQLHSKTVSSFDRLDDAIDKGDWEHHTPAALETPR